MDRNNFSLYRIEFDRNDFRLKRPNFINGRVPNHKCSINFLLIFTTVFQYLPTFLTVNKLWCWVDPSVPLILVSLPNSLILNATVTIHNIIVVEVFLKQCYLYT